MCEFLTERMLNFSHEFLSNVGEFKSKDCVLKIMYLELVWWINLNVAIMICEPHSVD